MYNKLIYSLIFLTLSIKPLIANEDFMSLRNDKVNLRQGPSFDHPVKLYYQKKYLPVQIIDNFENFKQIQDHENNAGWIHTTQLSKKKSALVTEDNTYIYSSNTIYSKPLAIAEKGKLFLIKKCNLNWCKVTADEVTGWTQRKNLEGNLG